MALPDSYAGVITALKIKSGSQKFYKPNFQGVIEAILDMGGGGGGSVEILPPGTDLPTTGDEEDGDMIGIPNADGNYFLYIYADGAWQPINITTAQVLEADKKPVGATMPKFITPDGTVLETQQDYNNYIVEVIINDQIRQDEDLEDLWKDQERQDQAIEDLETALYGDGNECDPKDITTELVFAYWNEGDDITKVYWTGDYLNLPYGSNFGWNNPSAPVDCPDALYINGVKHEVTKGNNWSGMHWNYYLATAPDAALDGEVVTVSQCPPSSGQFVTQDELAKDQARQDQELADYKQEVQADQDRQDNALQDEIDARVERDALHDAEIDTLEYKLDALLGLTFRGTYEFKHEADCDAAYLACMNAAGADMNAQQACTREYASCEQDKVLPGCFEAVDPDDQFDHLEQIIISKSDASGVEVDWAGVLNAGDYLEVDHVFAGQLDKTNYGLYRIEEEPEVTTNAHGHEVYTMKLQFLQGDGVMLVDEKYEIRGITAAEGVNPEELADFLTKDQAAATYLPLTGGTLLGTLNMKDNAAIKTRHLDSGQNSNLQIKHNGVSKVYVGEDETAFKNDIKLSSNDIGGVGNISINTDGCIKHNDNERLKFQSKSTSNPGDGLVVFERPDSHGRRGITVRGLHPDDNKETDILWSYTNASNGDAINYDGKMSADTNLVNRGWIDANKAAKNHSHSNYASSSHTHSDYAAKNHTHSGYASSSHNHNSSYVKGNYTITKSGNLYLIS